MSFLSSRLYTFIDTAYLRGRSVVEIAEQLCEGGSDIIQLRCKDLPADGALRLAEQVLPITTRAGVPLVINDFLAVALEIKAPYCHLGQEDFFDAGRRHVDEIRPQGGTLAIGLSSHDPEQALRAVEAGAAYLGVGPVFATPTKPGATPATLDFVRWAAANISIPWFAIGGITLETLEPVLAAGARRICVVSAISNARDIVRACQDFKRRLPS